MCVLLIRNERTTKLEKNTKNLSAMVQVVVSSNPVAAPVAAPVVALAPEHTFVDEWGYKTDAFISHADAQKEWFLTPSMLAK